MNMGKLTTEDTRKLERILKEMTEYISNANTMIAEGDMTHDVYHDIVKDLTRAVILKAGITSALAEYGTNPRLNLTFVRNEGNK
jgi:hypothetical protein